jgi:hypothetical protein
MKKIIYALATLILVIGCNKKVEVKSAEKVGSYVKFGKIISAEDAITKEDLLEKYKSMKPTDTLNVKVLSKITDVCQKKGCWMNLDLGEGKSTFVKFKDYAFFVPKNATNCEAIVNGKAFIEVTSVADLKEYAKDAGKSKGAIDSIKAPETNFSFLADGVLIKK